MRRRTVLSTWVRILTSLSLSFLRLLLRAGTVLSRYHSNTVMSKQCHDKTVKH